MEGRREREGGRGREREGGRKGGREGERERETEREREREREREAEREAARPPSTECVCSTHLFIHECLFNAVCGYIVGVDETEHFEEELPSVRHNALRDILHRIHVLSIKQE